MTAAQDMQEHQGEKPVENAGNKNNLAEENSDRLVDSVEGPSSGSGKSDRLRRTLQSNFQRQLEDVPTSPVPLGDFNGRETPVASVASPPKAGLKPPPPVGGVHPEANVVPQPQIVDNNQVSHRFYAIGKFIYMENSQDPIGYVSGNDQFFASDAFRDLFKQAGNDVLFVPHNFGDQAKVDWRDKLRTYDMELCFDLPKELPRGIDVKISTDPKADKILDCPELDASPIVAAPPREDRFTPPTARGMTYTYSVNHLKDSVEHALNIANQPEQNLEYARALQMYAASNWTLHNLIISFHEMVQRYEMIRAVSDTHKLH